MTSVPLEKRAVSSADSAAVSIAQTLKGIFAPLASLKLTVVLFAMSAFIVLAGTLAQSETGIWEVVTKYFRSYIVWIPLSVFFPPSMFSSMDWVSGGFWFPAGKSIGLALLANIVAAHVLRFKIQAKGSKLVLGMVITAIGVGITTMIILYGNWKDGIQDKPMFSWQFIWYAIFAGIIVLLIVSVVGMRSMLKQKRIIEMILLALVTVIMGGLVAWLILTGETLNDSAMRIVWNLVQGSIASLVMLVGCTMIFSKRGGIVLLHAGVALLMLNELFLAGSATEDQISVEEGKTTNVARDIRTLELTVTDRSGKEYDQVVAIPESLLATGQLIEDPKLPFDIYVDHMFFNSEFENLTRDEEPHVEYQDSRKVFVEPTQGDGRFARVVQLPRVGGADAGNASDWASAYVTLYKKGTFPGVTPNDTDKARSGNEEVEDTEKSKSDSETGEEGSEDKDEDEQDDNDAKNENIIATVWLSQMRQHAPTSMPDQGEHAEKVSFDDNDYELWLHFKRIYKPYQVKLENVEAAYYVGTTTARRFESTFKLIAGPNDEREVFIKMNEPLRYKGETFYQSNYSENAGRPGTREVSTFQIVSNDGWMIPYVACVIVGFGMLAQFSTGLFRFLQRKDDELIGNLVATNSRNSAEEIVLASSAESSTTDQAAKKTRKAKNNLPGGNSSPSSRQVNLGSIASGVTARLSDRKFYLPFIAASVLTAILLAPTLRSISSGGGDGEPNFDLLGKIPIANKGRIMPLDSYARVTLEKISQRQEIYYVDEEYERLQKLDKEPKEGALVDGKKRSAIEWMMDVMSRRDGIDDIRIFRIYDHDILAKLDLKPRKRYRYSFNEIAGKRDKIEDAFMKAQKVKAEDREVYHENLQEFADRFGAYNQLRNITMTPDALRKEFGRESDSGAEEIPLKELLPKYFQVAIEQKERITPLFVPKEIDRSEVNDSSENDAIPGTDARMKQWESLTVAAARLALLDYGRDNGVETTKQVGELVWNDIFGEDDARVDEMFYAQMERMIQQLSPDLSAEDMQRRAIEMTERSKNDPLMQSIREKLYGEVTAEKQQFVSVVTDFMETDTIPKTSEGPSTRLIEIIDDYRNEDFKDANEKTAAYLAKVDGIAPRDYSAYGVASEYFYNGLAPFYVCVVLYIVGFVLTCVGWLVAHQHVNRAAFWVLLFAVLLHGFGIYERIVISGRPPVTNLYSSAIFIGWAVVVVGLICELLFRMGIGNVMAAFGGAACLLIAQSMATGQDTFTVMVAVLDTQFWLATHVICITLGYATTYFAGIAGIIYIFVRLFASADQQKKFKFVAQIIYAMTCFALLFSFVGTVLGGLWADDSWGRFWGWDPKENGALIIVIWNALILHSRWGGMVRARGMAVLAVMGCIVTTWSWFGVNQLGVGLHAYGGSTNSVLLALTISVCTFLTIIMLGMVPERLLFGRLVTGASGDNSHDK